MEEMYLEHGEITFGKHHFPLHLHPGYCTLSFTLAGNALLVLSKRTIELKEGDIALIPPHIAHQTIIDNQFRYKIIRINVSSLRTFPDTIHVIKSKSNQLLYKDLLGLILDTPDNNFQHAWENIMNKFFSANKIKKEEAFGEVLSHLTQHFKEPVSLQDLSEIAKMSVSHFHRKFSHTFSISPMQYLMSLRIDHAKKLMQTETSLTEIALESGFYDQSHFIKYFKKYAGLRPKQFLNLLPS